MHTVFALLCFVVVIHWLIFPYPSGLLHWHCGNLTIAPVPAKQPWLIWINTSCEFIMNDCITTTKQNTTKPCAYFLGYTVVCFVDRECCVRQTTGIKSNCRKIELKSLTNFIILWSKSHNEKTLEVNDSRLFRHKMFIWCFAHHWCRCYDNYHR